jgi:uncharacterized protein YdaU (DUF1376 family)
MTLAFLDNANGALEAQSNSGLCLKRERPLSVSPQEPEMLMSLPFIAFHMRDYQRDTQQLPLEGHGAYFLLLQHCWTHGHIPADDVARAAICKVTVQRWRKALAPLVAGYFDANGCNKRATAEIAKAEKIRTRQAMAGHKGGVEAGIRKAARREMIEAVAEPPLSHGQAVAKPRSSHGEAIKRDITTNLSGAARAREAAEPAETPTKSTPEIADRPAGFAEQARQAVQQASGSLGSGELTAVLQAKGWVKP